MSYHWENTIWQSADGSWNRGFYKRISRSGSPNSWSDEDYDSEWDDDFDFTAFEYLRTGFSSEDSAANWRPGVNPGGFDLLVYRGNSKQCKELDQLAYWFKYPADKIKHDRKEHLRKNREHFKALQATWTPEAIRAALSGRIRLEAAIKGDERAYDYLGMHSSVRGTFEQKGDWLMLEGKRIYNLKTDKFEKHVHKLERYTAPRFGYGRGW